MYNYLIIFCFTLFYTSVFYPRKSQSSRLYPKRCERRGGCRRDGLRNNAFTDQADTVGIGGLRSHGLRYGPHHSHSARNQVRIARGVGAGG